MSGDHAVRLATRGERREERLRLRLLDTDTISLDWGSTTSLVQWCDVISVRSVGNHTEIVSDACVLKVRCPLKEVIEVLTDLGLVQIRRDLAVNAARVRRMVGGGRHRLVVILEDGESIAVGRQFQRDIRVRFGRPSV